jgi:uncharacterized protein with HEPN domain
LQDILESIDMIAQFARDMDLQAFREDPKTGFLRLPIYGETTDDQNRPNP